MTNANLKQHRAIKSFVIRSGRMTPSQEQAYAHYWKLYGLSEASKVVDYKTIFNNDNPVVLEIGFGMGDSLFEMAQACPDTNFIGIEVHKPGIGRLLNLVYQANLTNLKVFHHDAIEVLQQSIPSHSLMRIQVYFPDPWHKKKHHKRRIIQPEFLHLAYQKLASKGVLHLATDWRPYAESMLNLLEQSTEFENLSVESTFVGRPEYRPKTKFEKRGERLGHGVWDLCFMTKL